MTLTPTELALCMLAVWLVSAAVLTFGTWLLRRWWRQGIWPTACWRRAPKPGRGSIVGRAAEPIAKGQLVTVDLQRPNPWAEMRPAKPGVRGVEAIGSVMPPDLGMRPDSELLTGGVRQLPDKKED